jgi:hypothetical protein
MNVKNETGMLPTQRRLPHRNTSNSAVNIVTAIAIVSTSATARPAYSATANHMGLV